MVDSNQLRSMFAASMADMYGKEVGLYKDLVRITEESNESYLANKRSQLKSQGLSSVQIERALEEEIGPLDRVKGERHGAIRLGSPKELAEIVKIYDVLGMSPVGFYNLGATGGAAPVISTAGRPKDLDGPDINPFRLFTSVLDVEAMDWDKLTETKRQTLTKKYGTEARAKSEVIRIQNKMRDVIERRGIFPKSLNSDERVATLAQSELGDLVAAANHRELNTREAEKFIALITKIFEMSPTMVVSLEDYKDFRLLHEVAADILAFPNPHINHLTPRALDIADAYNRMEKEGHEKNFKMLKKIQGPAESLRPVVLLKQTSYVSKPTWVYIQQYNSQVVPWLKKVEASLKQTGITLKYDGDLDMAKFGLALDNAGLNLEVLFGDNTLAHFTLGDLQNALRRKIPNIEFPNCPAANLLIAAHTARFGEIEQRAIALTPDGRAIYDRTLDKANAAYKAYLDAFPKAERAKHDNNKEYQQIAGPIFAASELGNQQDQKEESQLVNGKLAYYIYRPIMGVDLKKHEHLIKDVAKKLKHSNGDNLPKIMQPLVDNGLLSRRPVVYEDFLPKSAAGIFKGNQRLAEGQESENASAVSRPASNDPKLKRFTDLDIPIYVQYNLFAAQEAQSILKVMSKFKDKGLITQHELSKSSSSLNDIVARRDATMEYQVPVEEKEAETLKKTAIKESKETYGWKAALTIGATLAVGGGIAALFALSVALVIAIPVTAAAVLLLGVMVDSLYKKKEAVDPGVKQPLERGAAGKNKESSLLSQSQEKEKCSGLLCKNEGSKVQTFIHNAAHGRNTMRDGAERLH